ncbi:MAG: GntR family transcriptional regulator [Clostridiaceae bacterium]|nr:GntR family transcriptional regulator [Clostridiaceae bacterium]
MNWTLVNDRPIYIQLTEQITQYIVAGVFKPGTRMMSVRDLAADAGVNPNTMQRAMAELERNGLVKTHRTTGRMITEDITMLNDIRNELVGACVAEFFDGMKTIGFSPKEAADLLSRQAKALEEQDNKEEQEGETA